MATIYPVLKENTEQQIFIGDAADTPNNPVIGAKWRQDDTGNELTYDGEAWHQSASGGVPFVNWSYQEGVKDAFGRLRVSNPETIFDSKQLYDSQPLFWDDIEESGASTTSSHSTATASTTIGVAATTAGKRVRQTFRRFNYQPGKSQLSFITFVLDDSGSGSGLIRNVGLFDDDNGIYISNVADDYYIILRRSISGSPSDVPVPQISWNIDRFVGSGPSGITLDFTKAQILVIDYEWLGVGRVRVGFVVGGNIYYAHEFNTANLGTGVYMSTPNLPIRYEIENQGAGAAATLETICSTVISEGGQQEIGAARYSSTNNTQVTCAVVGTIYLVKGIRLKSTALSATVKILTAAIQLQSASDDVEWRLIFDPTYSAGPTWGAETNSAVDTCTGAGETVTGGYAFSGGYAATGAANSAHDSLTQQVENALLLGSDIAGTAQTIALCCISLTNTNAIVEGSMTWREQQ